MCHVLVIEDEPLVAGYVADLAADGGATSIDFADTEAMAVEAAIARPPAVIMSDVRLAEGTGPRACLTIIERLGDVPVIFITGTPDACEPCHYAAAILEKPIVARQVVDAFRRAAPMKS